MIIRNEDDFYLDDSTGMCLTEDEIHEILRDQKTADPIHEQDIETLLEDWKEKTIDLVVALRDEEIPFEKEINPSIEVGETVIGTIVTDWTDINAFHSKGTKIKRVQVVSGEIEQKFNPQFVEERLNIFERKRLSEFLTTLYVRMCEVFKGQLDASHLDLISIFITCMNFKGREDPIWNLLSTIEEKDEKIDNQRREINDLRSKIRKLRKYNFSKHKNRP